jgi:hypothetical protein
LEAKELLKHAFLDELEKIKRAAPIGPSKLKLFLDGMKHEAGPALGATLGAGTAKAFGVDPLAGAAAGYGLGSIHDVVHGIKHRQRPVA